VSAYDLFLAPFAEFSFMRRALVGCLALSIACGPVGTLLILRRMSLMGDALSHAVLPGAAVGFLVGGLSLVAMSLGGAVAGIAVALLSGLVTRVTALREDASFAAFYLASLALGVLLVSVYGSSIDLLNVLFGSILAVDDAALLLIAAIASLAILTLAIVYRPLLMECFDPGYLRSVGGRGGLYHTIFLILVVVSLVAGFQALGTLMSVGLMMLPAAAARFWGRQVWSLSLTSGGIAFASAYVGLLLSYHANLPSGPAIILTAAAFYVVSLVVGTRESIRTRYLVRSHIHLEGA
jgi:zinc/manganese transport system permease protein